MKTLGISAGIATGAACAVKLLNSKLQLGNDIFLMRKMTGMMWEFARKLD